MLTRLLCFVLCSAINICSSFDPTNLLYTNQFAVHIPAGKGTADEVATRHEFLNLGQIGSLENYFLFEHLRLRKESVEASPEYLQLLDGDPNVYWFDQQVLKVRVKRGDKVPQREQQTPSPSFQIMGFTDPSLKDQWYLSPSKEGFDMNIPAAWRRGYTGKGVVVTIIDDGLQVNHPDLAANYDLQASMDLNDNDGDPTPEDNDQNKHGTRCAGVVAAVAGNNICGVGVAYNVSIGGVRLLDGAVHDASEAKAFGHNPDHVDIYSASWGIGDDGRTVEAPGTLAMRAFLQGVTNGRRGLGSIFVWASGDGGQHGDSCSCDGYTNSIFTVSVSSATQDGYKPFYAEECSSSIATTYSSGKKGADRTIATTDMDGRLRPDHICTLDHTGTSASAPMAAGLIALALEANRYLSWRDVQHLIVMTSKSEPLQHENGWDTNGVGRKFSHIFGYGLMDAGALVELAEKWTSVPPQHICKSKEIYARKEIPGTHLGNATVTTETFGCEGTNSEIGFLEHVQCKISLRFVPRGNLRILLTSPRGTTSVLLAERRRDLTGSTFDEWPFMSLHFWGENPKGLWTLQIINAGSRQIHQPGILKKWQLVLYGTDVDPVRLLSNSSLNKLHLEQQAVLQTPNKPYVVHEYVLPSGSEPVQEQGSRTVRSPCKNDYWIPVLNVCVSDCPDGYFGDGASKECLSCPRRCVSCRGRTSCTACERHFVLQNQTCVQM